MTTRPYWRVNLLGGKDSFRYAWYALKTDYGRPQKWLTSIGYVAEQRDLKNKENQSVTRLQYCGDTVAQHHADFSDSFGAYGSGILFLHGGLLETLDGPLLARLIDNKGGIYTHYERSNLDEDWRKIEYRTGLPFFDTGLCYTIMI